jgi:molybdopterin converting factor small subunit
MARLRLFAGLREAAGTSDVILSGNTVREVIEEAERRFGTGFGGGVPSARVWVNGEPAQPDDPVSDEDEIALIPPVSGGEMAVSSDSPGLVREGLLIATIVVVLGSTAVVPSRAWLAAAVVGVVAVWAIDLSFAAAARYLALSEIPVLAAVLVAGISVNTLGANGLGLSVAVAAVGVSGWAVLVRRQRDLVAIASAMVVAVVAATAVGSLILTHAPGDAGNSLIGVYLTAVTAAGLVSWALARSSGRPLIDPITGGGLAGIAGAVTAGWLWDVALAGVLIIAIAIVVALIAGRGLGSLIRTGNIYLVDDLPGRLVALDGPVMAATVLFPLVRLLL